MSPAQKKCICCVAAANKASYAMPLAGALAGGMALVVRALCEQHRAEVVGMSTYVIAVQAGVQETEAGVAATGPVKSTNLN